MSIWAETSVLQSQMRALHKQATPQSTLLFGAPATPRPNMPGLGNSTGVAINAKIPFHIKEEANCRGPHFQTGRYMFSILSLPDSSFFRVISVYGWSGNNTPDLQRGNTMLYNEIHSILLSLPVFPTIFAGDFNLNPRLFPAL